MALAQKTKGISAIERFTTFTANVAQVLDPTLTYKLNGDKIIDEYAEIANINPELLNSQEDVDAKRQAQAEQMQQLAQGAEMVKTLGGIDSSGADLQQRLGLG